MTHKVSDCASSRELAHSGMEYKHNIRVSLSPLSSQPRKRSEMNVTEKKRDY